MLVTTLPTVFSIPSKTEIIVLRPLKFLVCKCLQYSQGHNFAFGDNSEHMVHMEHMIRMSRLKSPDLWSQA